MLLGLQRQLLEVLQRIGQAVAGIGQRDRPDHSVRRLLAQVQRALAAADTQLFEPRRAEIGEQ